jgi:hypothetical protein
MFLEENINISYVKWNSVFQHLFQFMNRILNYVLENIPMYWLLTWMSRPYKQWNIKIFMEENDICTVFCIVFLPREDLKKWHFRRDIDGS